MNFGDSVARRVDHGLLLMEVQRRAGSPLAKKAPVTAPIAAASVAAAAASVAAAAVAAAAASVAAAPVAAASVAAAVAAAVAAGAGPSSSSSPQPTAKRARADGACRRCLQNDGSSRASQIRASTRTRDRGVNGGGHIRALPKVISKPAGASGLYGSDWRGVQQEPTLEGDRRRKSACPSSPARSP